jgi:hypothetical protein
MPWQLQELYLHINEFDGPVPPALAEMASLRVLYLR